ncbi:hypothetical protein CDAR_542251 [Caerostris darwini]|uniref:Uncharacterized protein n=1 Tax=Caerostris darwini TaxID=1538125 RepID=A0AAV4PDY7_9ARAC|nr:hypothetical protein CDAR_542251 [Caerostris darwini]
MFLSCCNSTWGHGTAPNNSNRLKHHPPSIAYCIIKKRSKQATKRGWPKKQESSWGTSQSTSKITASLGKESVPIPPWEPGKQSNKPLHQQKQRIRG